VNPLSATFLIVTAALGATLPGQQQRPNFVLLFTDDQGWTDVSGGRTNAGNGSDYYRTPNMDALAQAGTAFTRAHINGGQHGALCAPSRASLMTGRPLFRLFETGDRR